MQTTSAHDDFVGCRNPLSKDAQAGLAFACLTRLPTDDGTNPEIEAETEATHVTKD